MGLQTFAHGGYVRQCYAILATLALIPALSHAQGGGMTGGGSGISVVYNERRTLIDLVSAKPEFVDGPEYTLLRENFKATQLSGPDMSRHDAFRLALQLLRQWDLPASPATMALIGLLGNMRLEITAQFLPLNSSGYVADFLVGKISQAETVAQYTFSPPRSVLQISRPAFEKLGIISQAATLIHEGLRNYQFSFRAADSPLVIDDRVLQELTAIFALCQPQAKLLRYAKLIAGGHKQMHSIFHEVIKQECVSWPGK